MKRLLAWVAEEGFCDRSWLDEDWGSYGVRLGAGRLPADAYDPVKRTLDAFFATKTSEELMRAAVERKLLIAPVLDLSADHRERAAARTRGFPVAVGRERCAGRSLSRSLREVRGVPAPLPASRRRGSTNTATRCEAKPPRRPAPAGEREPRRAPPRRRQDPRPLLGDRRAGRHARCSRTTARPSCAWSPTRHLDTLRVSPPWQFTQPHPEGAAGFQSANANKLGITLDLATRQAGRAVVLDLVRWADVVTESFAPGVMDRAGARLGTICGRVKSGSHHALELHHGPDRTLARFRGLRPTGGEPRRASSRSRAGPTVRPPGPSAPTPTPSPRATTRSRSWRRSSTATRTGEGQYIDLSQTEAALHFLAPAFLDWTVNGHVPEPIGNADGDSTRHGMFPRRRRGPLGRDRRSDEGQRRALCLAIGRPDLCDRARSARASPRRRARGLGPSCARRRTAASAPGRGRPRASGPRHARALRGPPAPAPRTLHRDRQRSLPQHHDRELAPAAVADAGPHPERALSLGRDNAFVLETILGYPPRADRRAREARGAPVARKIRYSAHEWDTARPRSASRRPLATAAAGIPPAAGRE